MSALIEQLKFRPDWRLYIVGHAGYYALSLAVVSVLIAMLAIGVLVPIPGLDLGDAFTVGTLAAIGYAFGLTKFFRNEVSRLETMSPKSWLACDICVLLIWWLFIWAIALVGWVDLHVPYIASITALCMVVLGRWLRIDTIVLLLAGMLLVQSALYGRVMYTPWRFGFFLLDNPSLLWMLLISVLCLAGCALRLRGFKSFAAETES